MGVETINDLVDNVESKQVAGGDIDVILEMLTEDQKEELLCREYAGKSLKELVKKESQCPAEGVKALAEQVGISETGLLDCEKAKRFKALLQNPGCDHPAPVSMTRASPVRKINRRVKDDNEKAKEIMRHMMKILQAMMSG